MVTFVTALFVSVIVSGVMVLTLYARLFKEELQRNKKIHTILKAMEEQEADKGVKPSDNISRQLRIRWEGYLYLKYHNPTLD